MVQITAKALTQVPATLAGAGLAERTVLEKLYNKGSRSFTFRKDIYAAPDVKVSLIKLQHTKCCFCESRVIHVTDGDVEHFRPKAGYRQDRLSPLKQPGYYWLAYDWDNLLLACTKCNQRNKQNYFPLADDRKRARSHRGAINSESPLFIHPGLENPEKYLTFKNEKAQSVGKSQRGQMTIDILNLNRADLLDTRAELLQDVHQLLNIIRLGIDPKMKQQATRYLRQYKTSITKEGHTFAGMFRAYFTKNPV